MILPVLNSCTKDIHLSKLVLELCAKLDGKLDHPLLIVSDEQEVLTELSELAQHAFSKVTCHLYEPWTGEQKWPSIQNWAWQQTAQFLDGKKDFKASGWLWWEPDATPLRSGWLNALDEAYRSKPRTLFAGVECRIGGTRYMNGVGIYPFDIVDALANCHALYSRTEPFDIAAGRSVMGSFKPIQEIVNIRKAQGGGAGFSFKTVRQIGQFPDAVLLHGCTDGTLSKLILNGSVDPEEKQAETIFSISVVCYNNLELTRQCVDSILVHSGEAWELIITDNASTDGTARYLKQLKRRLESRLTIVTNSENKGFNEPNNHALTLARGKYFVTLNNDLTVCEGWLEIMARPFHENHKAAQVGIEGSAGHLSDECSGMVHKTKRDYIEASCMMIPAEIARTHGLFSSYLKFAYYEDADLSLRLRESGLEIVTVDLAINHHLNRSATTKLVQSEGKIPLMEYAVHNRTEMKQRWGWYLKRRTFDRTVLIQRDGANGDVLFLTPVLRALREKWPQCNLHVQTKCPTVLDGMPGVSVEMPLVADTVFDLNLAYEKWPKSHIVDAYAEACEVKVIDRNLEFQCSTSDEAEVPILMLGCHWVVIHSGPTKWNGRDWPEERFKSVAEHLRVNGFKIAVVGTNGNHRLISDLDLVGKTSIGQLYAIIKRADLFIGVDSLPFNLAQAAQIPAIGLFGTIDPKLRLVSPNAVALHAKPEDSPCLFQHHDLPPPVTFSQCDGACMRAITVEQVLEAAQQLLSAQETKKKRATTPILTLLLTLDDWSGIGRISNLLIEETLKLRKELGFDLEVLPVTQDYREKIPSKKITDTFIPRISEEAKFELRFMTYRSGPWPDPVKPMVIFIMWETNVVPQDFLSILNKAALVIVPNAWLACCLNAQGCKAPIDIVPLGIDLDHFKPRSIYKPHPFVFGSAGNTDCGGVRKNMPIVTEAFKIAFPDDENVRLKLKLSCGRAWEEKDSRIEMVTEFIPDMRDWYSDIHVFVSGSSCEGWGLHLHEAMAMGKPVIGANFGGATEFWNPSNGYAVPFTLTKAGGVYEGNGNYAKLDVQGMADAMRLAYEDRKTRALKGRLSIESAAQFPASRMAENLIAVLKRNGFL